MQLDEDGRDRLRALGQGARAELDDVAYARIAARLASEGPRVVRRARRVRFALRAGGALCALGVAGSLALPGLQPAPRAALKPARAPALVASATRACARRALVAEDFQPGAGETQRMVLGEAGLLAVQEGSAMWLDVSDGCRLRVHLLDGQVSVHAADLGGGELRVLTPSGDVIVQGTVFSVTHGADALRVDVDEGRVGVQRAGQSLTTMLVGGQRLSMSATEPPRIDPLDAAARAELREQVGLVPAPQAATASEPGASTRRAQARSASAPSSADALVAEADALWRRGELAQARERYRKAGALGGATAEAALLALARRELGLGRTAAARAALQAYDARFPRGELAAESAGIAFRTALQEGDLAGARRSAELLQRRYPRTPQAEAAARWLAEHGRR